MEALRQKCWVAGYCNTSSGRQKAAYGVVFQSGATIQEPALGEQSPAAAQLEGVYAAMLQADVPQPERSLVQFVIYTRSEMAAAAPFIVEQLASNGWKDKQGDPVRNREMMVRIKDQSVAMARRGIMVDIELSTKSDRHYEEALRLATSAANS